ncbi:MAG TPA: alanine racemase [Candidatus Kryptonia bacterium]|nr:alanine racemase [Candidatus Kryptonia bacterium]
MVELTAGARLTIDVGAICENWKAIRRRIGRADCGAVVKANAYGLGAERIAPALYVVGCRHFFVAHLHEAVVLRPTIRRDAAVYVLHGPILRTEAAFVEHDVIPVLNSPAQIAAWHALARKLDQTLPAVLQADTGMARLGLSQAELESVLEGGALDGIDVRYLMSHLVSAEDPSCEVNRVQLERFATTRSRLANVRASLANSSGIFLCGDYHFDLVRPGAALYGIAPTIGRDNPMRPVIRLEAPVIQLRTIEAGTAVGYGHRWTAQRRSRIATVAAGYADGYLRSASNRGFAYIDGARVPIIGTVSMDTLLVDVTDVGTPVHEGSLIELVGEHIGVDDLARGAVTIGYEMLTALGDRYERHYIGKLQ